MNSFIDPILEVIENIKLRLKGVEEITKVLQKIPIVDLSPKPMEIPTDKYGHYISKKKTKTYWVNVYKESLIPQTMALTVRASKEEADKHINKSMGFIKTISFEVEE